VSIPPIVPKDFVKVQQLLEQQQHTTSSYIVKVGPICSDSVLGGNWGGPSTTPVMTGPEANLGFKSKISSQLVF
jgi:hypothetical protein